MIWRRGTAATAPITCAHVVKLTAADERLWSRIKPMMQRERFQPPRVRDYAQALSAREEDVRQMLRRLAKMGQVIQVAPDHFFLRSTVVEMIAIADRLATGSADETVTAGAFRDKIGSGRKVAIQILEFFDRAGVTVRHGVPPAKRGLTSADLGAPTIIRGTADHFKERIRGAAAIIVILGRCEYPFEYSTNQSSL